MLRELAKSIREYKHLSIWTPILVSGEVVIKLGTEDQDHFLIADCFSCHTIDFDF